MNLGSKVATPQLFILAGPNGAGKTTAAKVLLPEILQVRQFVNADHIAAGLSPFDPASAAIRAGRIMIDRMQEFLRARESFAFETTLAGKSHAPFIQDARSKGYRVSLIFVYLRSSDLALHRVAQRVQRGGHDIPRETVERRFHRGLIHFFELYRPIVDTWTLCDNSDQSLILVAESPDQGKSAVYRPEILAGIEKNVERTKTFVSRA